MKHTDETAIALVVAATGAVAAEYPGTPSVFRDPRWVEAERAVDSAFLSRRSGALEAATDVFREMALTLFAEQMNDE